MDISTSGGQWGPCCSTLPTGTITTGSCLSAASNSWRHISCHNTFLFVPSNESYSMQVLPVFDQQPRPTCRRALRSCSPLPLVQHRLDVTRRALQGFAGRLLAGKDLDGELAVDGQDVGIARHDGRNALAIRHHLLEHLAHLAPALVFGTVQRIQRGGDPVEVVVVLEDGFLA